jgi:hypothetical protein
MAYLFTRQQLYELVWAGPITTLAKSLAISDVGLAVQREDRRQPGNRLVAQVLKAKIDEKTRVRRPLCLPAFVPCEPR